MSESETEQGIFEQVLKGDLDFASEPWPSISESAKDLVRRMLVRDPKRRLTAPEVLREYKTLFHLGKSNMQCVFGYDFRDYEHITVIGSFFKNS